MNTYSIHEDNMEKLERKLKRIHAKCEKHGCAFSYRQVGEEFREIKDDAGRTKVSRFILVEAEGTAKLNDWEFIAILEHTLSGNVIRSVSDIEVPERYYRSDTVCEHCNSKRRRKDTYIVRNTITGEFKQVGKSCLNEFTHGLSTEAVARYLSLFDELVDGETPPSGGGRESYIDKTTFLRYAAETIRHFGYVRTQDDGISTLSRTLDFYLYDNQGFRLSKEERLRIVKEMKKVRFNPDSEHARDKVSDVLTWVEQRDEDNNYFHNLKTVCSLQFLKFSNLGIAVSAFAAYDRSLEHMAEKAERERQTEEARIKEANSRHIGNIGDRIEIDVHSIRCLTNWETEWGTTFLFKITDKDGNVFTWKTSGGFHEDEVKIIKGTVKEHTEYNGVLQTGLTRCKTIA